MSMSKIEHSFAVLPGRFPESVRYLANLMHRGSKIVAYVEFLDTVPKFAALRDLVRRKKELIRHVEKHWQHYHGS